jgi:hypothetical protein
MVFVTVPVFAKAPFQIDTVKSEHVRCADFEGMERREVSRAGKSEVDW